MAALFKAMTHNELVWQTWFIPVLSFIDKHDSIRMWSYISVDWDDLPMWRDRHAAGVILV